MDLTAYYHVLFSGGIGIVGTLLGTTVAYRLSWRLAERQAVHARERADREASRVAASKLRAAFAPTLAQLDLGRRHGSTHNAPDIDGYLKTALLNHAAAIEEFRVFVPSGERGAYQEAWSEYYESAKDGMFVAEAFDSTNPWSVIEGKIHIILTFAKTEATASTRST